MTVCCGPQVIFCSIRESNLETPAIIPPCSDTVTVLFSKYTIGQHISASTWNKLFSLPLSDLAKLCFILSNRITVTMTRFKILLFVEEESSYKSTFLLQATKTMNRFCRSNFILVYFLQQQQTCLHGITFNIYMYYTISSLHTFLKIEK